MVGASALIGLLAWALTAQAGANRQAAKAAAVAATGQATANVVALLLVALLLLVLGGAASVVAYAWVLRQRAGRDQRYATDTKEGASQALQQWASKSPHYGAGDSLAALIQLEILHALRALHAQQRTHPYPPAYRDPSAMRLTEEASDAFEEDVPTDVDLWTW
jgi:hypothetical protein